MKYWRQFTAWIVPFVLAVLAVAAVNKSRKKKAQAERAFERIRRHTENDIGEQAAEFEYHADTHMSAQKAAQKANDDATNRIKALAESDPDIGDLLDDYRRERLHD